MLQQNYLASEYSELICNKKTSYAMLAKQVILTTSQVIYLQLRTGRMQLDIELYNAYLPIK